jgi:hypothetical protein
MALVKAKGRHDFKSYQKIVDSTVFTSNFVVLKASEVPFARFEKFFENYTEHLQDI